jgi:hypothetical protein
MYFVSIYENIRMKPGEIGEEGGNDRWGKSN